MRVAATIGIDWGNAHAAAANAKLMRGDDSLHFIMLDQPARFAAAVDAFLAN